MKTLVLSVLCILSVCTCLSQNKETLLRGNENSTALETITATKDGNFIATGAAPYVYYSAEKRIVTMLTQTGGALWTTVIADSTGVGTRMTRWSVAQAKGKGYFLSALASNGSQSFIVVIKMDDNGNIKRVQKVSNKTNTWQSLGKIAVAEDGNILLCGEQDDLFHKHAFLLKIDVHTGDLIWAQALGTTTGDQGKESEAFSSILPTADNGCIVGGRDWHFSGTDFLYTKYDENGNLSWIKRIRADYFSNLPGDLPYVSATPDGGFVFGGNAGIKGRYYNFFLKADASGALQWIKEINNPAERRMGVITGIAVNADNSYTATGYYRHSYMNRNLAYACNVNSNGDLQWYNLLSSYELRTRNGIQKRNVFYKNIAPAADGGYMAAGYVEFAYLNGKSTTDSMLVVKLNHEGHTCRDSAAGGSLTNVAFTEPAFTYETADISGYIKIKDTAMFTQHNMELGTRNTCNDNTFAQSAESSAAIATGNTAFRIYPNPVANNNISFTFKSSSAGAAIVIIKDINGRVVYSEKIATSPGTINKAIYIAQLAKGTYFISLNDNKKIQTLSFVKQ